MPPLGWKTAQAGADLVREGEQVQLGAELAVVALLGLLEELQVRLQLVLGRPGGAVDALELRVLLAAAPVGGRRAHQLERRDVPGGGQVRAAAQVLPAQLAGLGVEVVVDGQLAARRPRRPRRRRRPRQPLRPISSSLYGSSASSSRASSSVTTRRENRWPCLIDLLHLLLDGLEVLGGERLLDVEVVVEAVLDRRADAELGLGEELLHGLGHDVRGGVAQDVQAVLGGDLDRLDLVAVRDLVREVLQLARRRGRRRSVRSPAKRSAAVVPVVTTRSSRSESRWMITRTSDTGLS